MLFHSEMAELHSASPREITSPFTREIISVLHSKACNNLYISDIQFIATGRVAPVRGFNYI